MPVIINKGYTPCCKSDAELKPTPSGTWFHFHDEMDRKHIHPLLNDLENKTNGADMYYVLSMYPLQLAKWMRGKEATEYI